MTGPRPDSWMGFLLDLEVGQRAYVETTLDTYNRLMHRLNPTMSRRPAALQSREFVTNLFTAISNSKAGDVRYLVCVERRK